jgi:hypothetical protein
MGLNDMKMGLPKEYPLYEIAYGSDIPYEQLYVAWFNSIPSRATFLPKKYSKEILEYLLGMGFTLKSEDIKMGRTSERISYVRFLVSDEKQLFISLESHYDKEIQYYYTITTYYNAINGEYEEQVKEYDFEKYKTETKKAGINLVKMDMGHLDTEEYDLTIPDIDIKMNYGENFLKIHDTIVKRLNNSNDKGIILFHGDPGTGKTSYIKYLTSLIKDKEILFIPPSMAESLSEPSIIPFLMEHKNSILIVEDAERVIADREGNGSSAGVSNILNLTDGILGDCLGIQIIATFNMKREKIDSALLRKGRLIAEHKFTPLTVEETNILLKHLGKTKTVDIGMTLSDIYNIDEEVFKTENKKQIGFN